MKLTIEIESDNEACSSREDATRMLRVLARKIDSGRSAGKVLDANGNTVGVWDFECEESDKEDL